MHVCVKERECVKGALYLHCAIAILLKGFHQGAHLFF
jgi:hypothetical protein